MPKLNKINIHNSICLDYYFLFINIIFFVKYKKLNYRLYN